MVDLVPAQPARTTVSLLLPVDTPEVLLAVFAVGNVVAFNALGRSSRRFSGRRRTRRGGPEVETYESWSSQELGQLADLASDWMFTLE